MPPTAQLPPRFPCHSDTSTHTARFNARRSDMLQKHEIPSHEISFEEQSWWVDDLVGSCREGGSKPLLAPLRRSVSDPLAILEESSKFDFDLSATDDEIPELDGTDDELLQFLGKPVGCNKSGSILCLTPSSQFGNDSDSALSSISSTQMEKNSDSTCGMNPHTSSNTGGFDPLYGPNSPREMEKGSSSVYFMCSPRQTEKSSSSVYGPNSPRRMEKLTHPESSIVSAIFESTRKKSFGYAALDPSNANVAVSKHHVDVASGTCDYEKTSHRHAGQRSRIRKIQYIAELERTVTFYQALEADLTARVGMLYQQRAALSIENKTLKQEIVNLERNKLIKEGQHHFLKNELNKLKATFSHHRKTKSSSFFPLDAIGADVSDGKWCMRGAGKLSWDGNSIPLPKPEFQS